MSEAPVEALPPLLPESAAPPPAAVLRRLFLTLFLRGRGARGLRKATAPTSIAKKLGMVLFVYALFGLLGLIFLRQSVFALSAYLHAMTLSFLGLYVASSAGEVLFNREENDILLHRPVSPRTMLWAKIRVLVEVSLWVSGAFNLAGFFIGIWVPGGTWRYPFVHAGTTGLEALFCTGSVVLGYQFCLTFFGRARLEGLITTAQIVVSVGAVLAGQVVPRIMFRAGAMLHFQATAWWTWIVPPAWFAGLDDALAGSGAAASWRLGALGVTATAAILGCAFGLLARSYQRGMQVLNETISPAPRAEGRRRWLQVLANRAPLSWVLRDPITRASFVLTGAYLIRDRDVKLRVFPGIAPMMALPFVLLFQLRDLGGGRSAAMAQGGTLAFGGMYFGVVPLLGLGLLQYSQQWQASDIFRSAPLVGPGKICGGARWAVLLFLTLPLLLVYSGALYWVIGPQRFLLLLLPGVIALPVYAYIAQIRGGGIPFSRATEEAKSAGRGVLIIVVMIVSGLAAALGAFAYATGWLGWFLLGETAAAGVLCWIFDRRIAAAPWEPLE